MFVSCLSKADKNTLLLFYNLLSLSDNPILWDGKSYGEVTADDDLSNLSIAENKKENELLEQLATAADLPSNERVYERAERLLLEELRKYPIHQMELTENRVIASTTVMLRVLNDLDEEGIIRNLAVPKIMLFEMFLLALRDGIISEIEEELLKLFQNHYQIEDFVYEDLLEGAEALNMEVSKITAILFE